MEDLKKHLEQLKKNSQNSLQRNTDLIHQNELDDGKISIYSGPLDPQVVFKCVVLIKHAFPALPIEFYDILEERATENKFSSQRLLHAVYHVIDTCVYPTPTIAQFISYDKKVVFNTISDMNNIVHESGGDRNIWDEDYTGVIRDRKPYWVRKSDYDLVKHLVQPMTFTNGIMDNVDNVKQQSENIR